MSGEWREPSGESRTAMPAGPVARVTGTAVVLRGDDVDTDRIMPARFLRALTFDGLGDHVFEDDRQACAARGERHPFDAPHARAAAILLVNRNFGCGSSREHAPQGLLRHGIRAIVGESFAEIFFGNAASLGIPCVVAAHAAIAGLMDQAERQPGEALAIDLEPMTARAGDLCAPIDLPQPVREAFLDGTWDATGLLLEDFAAVREVASRLPYLRGF
jgi:3-isopropylmalate/(R)-2-methylmalate dehydratase small subunit